MSLCRSKPFGCLLIIVVCVQLLILYFAVTEFVLNPTNSEYLKINRREEDTSDDGKDKAAFNEDELISVFAKATLDPERLMEISKATPLKIKHRPAYWNGPEPLAEKSSKTKRKLTDFEAKGNNILLTIRTTKKFHQKRLPVLFETWINKFNGSNIFLVTDDEDEEYMTKTRELDIHYVIVSCGKTYGRWSLCCKSGEEMSLMHKPENKHYDWFCHIDDDIYVNQQNLVKLLSLYDPKNESVYIGRAGSMWKYPKKLESKQTLIENPKRDIRFHFAVGGLYCLSRPMINKVRPWLGDGKTMGDTCDRLYEPEDVAVAATVELLAGERLTRTNLFHPHGLILSKAVNPSKIKDQVGFAYGCGQLCGYKAYYRNAIKVPNAVFPYEEDPSRFKSIYCHLYPDDGSCKR